MGKEAFQGHAAQQFIGACPPALAATEGSGRPEPDRPRLSPWRRVGWELQSDCGRKSQGNSRLNEEQAGRRTMTSYQTAAARPPAGRWLQLLIGIVCMVMIANLQYGWTL